MDENRQYFKVEFVVTILNRSRWLTVRFLCTALSNRAQTIWDLRQMQCLGKNFLCRNLCCKYFFVSHMKQFQASSN